MNARVKEAMLWGVVGLLTFLVLLQGYELLQDLRVDLWVKAGAAATVGVATTAITYLANRRLTASTEPTDSQTTSTAEGGDDEQEPSE